MDAELLIFFHLIGAFIRWAFTGFRGPLSDRVEQDHPVLDGIIGFVAFVLITAGFLKIVGAF